jgi:hypothetical protein
MTKLPRWIVLTALLIAAIVPARSHAEPTEEYRVKAAFIYNFAKFIEWSPEAYESSASPIVLCILGDDPFETALDSVEGKKVGERKLVIKRIKKVQDGDGCQILFICSSEKEGLPQILKALQGSSVLTISDMDRFTDQGGVIGFVLADNKIRFDINLGAARLSKLEISSKLLKLAERVRENR